MDSLRNGVYAEAWDESGCDYSTAERIARGKIAETKQLLVYFKSLGKTQLNSIKEDIQEYVDQVRALEKRAHDDSTLQTMLRTNRRRAKGARLYLKDTIKYQRSIAAILTAKIREHQGVIKQVQKLKAPNSICLRKSLVKAEAHVKETAYIG